MSGGYSASVQKVVLAASLFALAPIVNAAGNSPTNSTNSPANSTHIDGSSSNSNSNTNSKPPAQNASPPATVPLAPVITPALPPTQTTPQNSNPQPLPPTPAPNVGPSTGVGSGPGTSATTPMATPTVPEQSGQYDKQKAIQEFVRQAANYILANGKEASIKEFNRTDGAFTKDSLYIFAIDYKGTVLAAPFADDSKMIGTNQFNFKDADGTPVVQLLIQKAKSGGGWTKFKWENPVTKKMECKNAYSMPGDGDFLIASGYYYPPAATGKCEE